MDPIDETETDPVEVVETEEIDLEAEFETFAEEVLGFTVFADLVLEMIQENEE